MIGQIVASNVRTYHDEHPWVHTDRDTELDAYSKPTADPNRYTFEWKFYWYNSGLQQWVWDQEGDRSGQLVQYRFKIQPWPYLAVDYRVILEIKDTQQGNRRVSGDILHAITRE
jgi:hypothetical protein